MTYEGHIWYFYIYGYSMENKNCSLVQIFWSVCAVMWNLHEYYIIRSQYQKSHVTPHYNHLDPRNTMVPLMMLVASCNANTRTNYVTWPKMSCCTSFHLSWPVECSHATDNTIGIMWHHYWWQWYHWLKIMLHMILPVIDQRNEMVPLMTLLASGYTDVSTIAITWPKCHVAPQLHSKLHWPKECNAAIDDAVGSIWHWCQWKWHKIMMESCCSSFQMSWPKKRYGAIDGAVQTTWCWH